MWKYIWNNNTSVPSSTRWTSSGDTQGGLLSDKKYSTFFSVNNWKNTIKSVDKMYFQKKNDFFSKHNLKKDRSIQRRPWQCYWGGTSSIDNSSKCGLYQIQRPTVIQSCNMQIWTKTNYIVLSHWFTGSLSTTQGDALQSPGFSSGINRLHLSHRWLDEPISACTVAGPLVEMDQRAFRLRVYKDSGTLVIAWDRSSLIIIYPLIYNVYSLLPGVNWAEHLCQDHHQM